MGNATSRPPEELVASLPPRTQKKLNEIACPNFFEAAFLATDPVRVSQKRSASSVATLLGTPSSMTESNNSSGGMLPNCNSKIDFEIIHGRRYQISPGSHFYLPCDDDEADRLVIMVEYKINAKKLR
jgi:hypothetical protein